MAVMADSLDGLDRVADLATVYSGLLDVLDLTDVTVIGNSIGGWIAAELGLLGSPRVGRLVMVDAVGIGKRQGQRVDSEGGGRFSDPGKRLAANDRFGRCVREHGGQSDIDRMFP